MGTTSKIIYGSVLSLLILMMFLIFYMQKSAQLTLDMKDNQHKVAELQKTLDATNTAAESAKSKNKLIPELTENIAVIEKEKAAFLQELDDLKGNLKKQSSLASERSNEIDQLKNTQTERQQLLATTESQLSNISDSLKTMQKELAQREEQLDQTSIAIVEKDQAISFYTEKLDALEQSISLAKSKSTSKAMNLTLILDELASKTKRANQLEDKIEQLAGTAGFSAIIPANASDKDVTVISELQALFEKMNKESAPPADTELPKAMAQIEELNIGNATLLSKINAQSARIQALQDELQKKEDTLAAEKEILYIQQMDNKALIGELEDTVKQGHDATIPLKEQITSLEIKLEEALETNTALADTLTSSEEQFAELMASKDSLNNELIPAQTALAAALAQVTQLTSDFETTTTSLKQKEDVRLSLTTELEEVKGGLTVAQEKYETLNVQFAALETELTELKAKDEQQAEEATTSLKQNEDVRLSLTTELEEAKGGLAEAQEKYETLNIQFATLETELTEFKTKDEQQAEQVTTMQGLLDQQTSATEQSQSDLSTKLTAAEGETVRLKTELEKFTTTVAEKDLRIQELTGKITENSDQLTTLQASLDQANESINSKAEGSTDQKQKIAALIAEIAAAKTLSDQQAASQTSFLAEKETAIQSLTTQLSDNSTKLADETAAAKSLSDEQAALLASTKEQLAALEAKQQGMEATLSENETQLTKSQEEITALKEQIAGLTAERDTIKLKNTDSDKDGVSDADDTCPETAEGAKVNAQGCEEDSDNDGLVNRLDLCPDTATGATVDKAGCSAEQTTVVLEGITFKLGTAKLTKEASSILDIAANILQSNPEIIMEVAGHTDSIGVKESNLRLSTLRAQSVTTFLVSKGVSSERLQAKGYGAEEPIDDNTTKVGRAKNRRVELRRVDSFTTVQPEAETAAPTVSE